MQLSLSSLVKLLLVAAVAVDAASLNVKRSPASEYSGRFLGTTYTPFKADGSCRTVDQIKEDISNLAGFELLRLYSNDCSVVQYAAEVFPGKLIVAVNDISSKDGISNDLYSIAASLGFAGTTFNEKVHSVVVGNELVYNKWYTADDVVNFISEARSIFPYFPGQWTTGETVSSFYGNPQLCSAVDYVGINNHPFFDHQTSATAGDYVLSHIEAVAQFCKEHGADKKVVTLETGWPWKGDTWEGTAVASSQDQTIAINNIANSAGNDCIAYSAYNELWRLATENGGIAQAWGFLGNAPSSA